MPIAAAIPLRRMLDSAFDSEPACSTMDCFTYMAAYQTSNPARHDCHSDLSVLWHENEDTGENDPDQAAIAQCGDGLHQQVQDGIPQICLDPIQNGQFKKEHSYHLVSLVVSESSAGFRDDPQWLQYWSSGPQSIPQVGQATWNLAPQVRQKDPFLCQAPQEPHR